MQLFNPEHFDGDMLYLDLDVVVARDLDFVKTSPTNYLWAIRDFKYLQSRHANAINSSMMWFNVTNFAWIWQKFTQEDFVTVIKSYPGDQDYLAAVLDVNQRRFFENKYFESYRWQCLDGGFDFHKRKHLRPGSGVKIADDTALVVFHGKPKPHEVQHPVIVQLWK